jgi:hypothetical protein
VADEHGKPLAAELVPSPASNAPANVDAPYPICVGCGGWHGGVGAEINCLRTSVLRLRFVIATHQDDHAIAAGARRARLVLAEVLADAAIPHWGERVRDLAARLTAELTPPEKGPSTP